MKAIPLSFYGNPLLFGRDDAPGLLAFVPGEDRVRVHARRDGATVTEETPFRPFMLLAEADLLDGFPGEREVIALEGEGAYRWLATFPAWSVAEQAREHCREASGHSPGDPQGPYLFFSDPIHQYLLRTGRTSFRGLTLGDLRRLALDIEVLTTPGFEFPNAARDGDRIIAIALADSSGWSTVLSGAEMDEADLLRACGGLIAERDPDVIEGHNIFRFDLEYLEARARRHRVPLGWGRGGALLRGYGARMQVAERTISYRRYLLPGRHIVDTWMLAQLYDVSARDLDAYGLKDVARHFGVAAPERTYLAPEEIPRVFREDPARLMAYARDDVLETLAVSAILSPPYFVQAQALPFDYESVVLRGNATKIDALLLREYLHRGRAVPRASAGRSVAGGFTAVYQQGVARNVLHVDVTSLYPSLMLSQGILPAADTAGVFGEMLRDLREFRVTAKRMAREAPVEADRLLLGALQQTFKILINSFYGYLGTGFGRWNDFEAANRITSEGRRLVTGLVERLGELGATVIEVDTDGIYFVPPEDYTAPEREEELLARLAETFPEGLQLELGGRYPAMFSYKMKNYVLLDRGGKLLVKGSGLRSRGIELYLRRWMEEMFRLLLTGRRDEIPALLRRWEEDFAARRVPVRLFMKTETLQESPGAYRDKVASGLRNAGAAYELALRAERPYQAGDQVSYYVTGEGAQVMVNETAKLAAAWDAAAPDENTAYYVAKLRELAEKFLPFVERDGLVEVVPEEEPPPAPVQLTLDLGV